jgi:hypothetical protein
MYEGLAQSCEEMMGTLLDSSAEALLLQYKALYIKRVGIDVSKRKDLREKVDALLRAEASSGRMGSSPCSADR